VLVVFLQLDICLILFITFNHMPNRRTNPFIREDWAYDNGPARGVTSRRGALARFRKDWIAVPRGRRPKNRDFMLQWLALIKGPVKWDNNRLHIPEGCITIAQFRRKFRYIRNTTMYQYRKKVKEKLLICKAQVDSNIMSSDQQAFFKEFPFAPLSTFTHPSIRGIEGAIRNMYQVDEYDTLKNDPSYSREAIVERYRVFFPHAKNAQDDYPDYPWWEPIPWTIYREDTIPYLKKISMDSPSITYRKLSNKPELAHLQPKKCPKKNIADSKLTTIYSKHWYDTTIPMSIEKYNAMLDDMISYSFVKIKDTF